MKSKTKWRVIYWDDNQDKQVIFGCHTYEQAVTKAAQVMKKFGRSAEIQLK